jgi:serine/threonine protein kinase/class 3 adenylate cyclase
MTSHPSSPGTMRARISAEDIVLYANRALAVYLGVSKEELIGTPLEVLAGCCEGEMAACFQRPEGGRQSNRLVADASGRVFEIRTSSESGVLDIILDEVTTAAAVSGVLAGVTGTLVDDLNEEELRTVRQPEKRYITIGFTLLREMNAFAEKLPPGEVRQVVDSFLEEAADATIEAGCTVGSVSGESITGIYGAPRHFLDHPLRAVKAACDILRKGAALHAGFTLQGRELPPCSIGLWTGETVIGTFGSGVSRHYGALGSPVELAGRLARLARPGEILLPEHTLTHLLRVLPEGWSHLRAESENGPDLSDFQWVGDEIVPVPDHLRKILYLVGPSIEDNPDGAEYIMEYLWALRVEGRGGAVPILRVWRPAAVGDGLELGSDNVVASSPVETLGKYKLHEVIGTGGMGRVWRGTDRFGNNVAIKVLHGQGTPAESQIRRFRREAEVMARLAHRNICRVFEMNEFEGMLYIAMEYVDGLTLSDLLYAENTSSSSTPRNAPDLGTLIRSLRDEKSARDSLVRESPAGPEDAGATEEPAPERPEETLVLPVEQTLKIFLGVCEAVQFAHEHGVLHRDLKPGNILLREDGEPLVADFGLAKLSSDDGTQSLSLSGHVVGTLENMPPEQAESSKDVDERADVYALGTILYQMLTGRRHFRATGNIVNDAQLLKTHEPPRLRQFNPKIDPDLEIITLKALRNNPDARYRSVSALRADVERFRRGEVITAKPVSAVDLVRKLVRRNRAVTAVTLAAIVLITATVVGAVWSLTNQLAREQSARREAEEARREAETHKGFAEEKRKEAEAKEQAADEERRRAEALLAQKEAAEKEAEAARARSEVLRAETEAERELRLEAERRASAKDDLLASTQQQIADMEAATRARDGVRPDEQVPAFSRPRDFAPRDREAAFAARRALGEAMSILNFEMSPFELQSSERNPQRILDRLSRAIDLVSASLLVEPRFAPAWVMQGRLYLGALEFARAEAAFERAAQLRGNDPGIEGDDDVPGLRDLASGLATGTQTDPARAATLLEASSNPGDQAAGRLMAFFAGKTALPRRSNPMDSPLGRTPRAPELALEVMVANNLGTPPRLESDPLDPSAETSSLRIEGGAANLAALKGLPIKRVEAPGASELDWETLGTFPLESLDITGATLGSIPATLRSGPRIRTLLLGDSRITSLEAARRMPQLETLDLSSAEVRDLSPLVNCRRLRYLDVSGADRAGLRVLLNLPLESLTISPLLITDKDSLNALRGHRTLRSLRTPADPETHLPAAFWKKWDAGAYNVSHGPGENPPDGP